MTDQELQTAERVPTLAEVMNEHYRRVLRLTGGHKVRAAILLGVSFKTVYNWCRRHRDTVPLTEPKS